MWVDFVSASAERNQLFVFRSTPDVPEQPWQPQAEPRHQRHPVRPQRWQQGQDQPGPGPPRQRHHASPRHQSAERRGRAEHGFQAPGPQHRDQRRRRLRQGQDDFGAQGRCDRLRHGPAGQQRLHRHRSEGLIHRRRPASRLITRVRHPNRSPFEEGGFSFAVKAL